MIQIELFATLFGLIYLVLIIKENKWGWIAGVFSSLLYVIICICSELFIQAGLQGLYAILGFLGFFKWNSKNKLITAVPLINKLWLLVYAIILTFGIGFCMSFTSQKSPYLDSFLGVFGLIATYLTTEKQIENWIIWIIVNGLSMFLFFQEELFMSTFLFLLYFCLSIYGYLNWKKEIPHEGKN